MSNSLASLAINDTVFAFSLASEETTTSHFTIKSLLTVASPLNSTLKESDLLSVSAPFPITKAVFPRLYSKALFVIVEPEELYCPITVENPIF